MWQLIGSALAGLVILLAMPVYNDIQANNLTATVDADAASQFQTILAGAQKYVAAQKDTLTDTLSIGGAYQEIPFADLLNTDSLPGGFSQTNVLGATWHVYVQQPASGAIRTMVAATGGLKLKQSDLINIAGLTGDQGGYVPYDGMLGLNSSEAHGTTWNLSLAGLPSPGAGHLFGTVTVGDAASPTIDTNDFLYRVGVPGHDELNTMGVTLNMGSNNINNVATLNAKQGVFSSNVTVTAGGCAFNAPGTCLYGDGTNSAVRTKGSVYFQHMDGSAADTNANHATMQAAITGTDNGTAISGGACSPNGAFASSTDGTGTHLECVNGVWKTLGGGGTGLISFFSVNDICFGGPYCNHPADMSSTSVFVSNFFGPDNPNGYTVGPSVAAVYGTSPFGTTFSCPANTHVLLMTQTYHPNDDIGPNDIIYNETLNAYDDLFGCFTN